MEQVEPTGSKQYTKEQFVQRLSELCVETGFTIGAHPEFKLRDDNTFSVVVVMTVEKMPDAKGG